MKKCPNCGKEIQDEAILCRYCHIKFDEYAKRQEELQYFIKSIENLTVSAREDYEKEVKRISDCLDVLATSLDVSEARNKLNQAVDKQKGWKQEALYQKWISKVDTDDIGTLHGLINSFAGLGDYKEAVKYKELCKSRLEEYERKLLEIKREQQYQTAVSKMKVVSISSYEEAYKVLASIGEYKDCQEKLNCCNSILSELKKEEEQKRIEKEKKDAEIEAEKARKQKKIAKVSVLIGCAAVCIVLLIGLGYWMNLNNQYSQASAYKEAGDYSSAKKQFEELGDYKDSKHLLDICEKELQYEQADGAVALTNKNS